MPKTKEPQELREENIAAIAAEFFSHESYEKFYDKYCDDLEGTPGIWRWMLVVAGAFSVVEATESTGGNHDWLEAIDDYVEGVHMACETSLPTVAELRQIAHVAFGRN